MKCHPCDIAGVAVESEKRIWVGTFDVVELDVLIASYRKPALIGGDAKTVDLGVGMLNCAGTDS